MSPPEDNRQALPWIVLTLVVLPPLAIFAPVLFQDRSLAFRDTAVFYHPLFAWIEQQSVQGELPLWNPHANFGTPLVGEASSSMFYPGKALLLLPLEFSWKFKLYVVGHVFLAAAGAYYASRRFGTSREAAALAAISYACGGAVLFQSCNVIFLVGAAWLPWAFAATEVMLRERSLRAALGLGVILAMMTLGGDPQMAYHAGLAAAVYALGLWWIEAPQGKAASELGNRWRSLRTLAGLLVVAAGSAFILSAVQTFPAAEASASSDRAAYHAPRNVYEAARVIATEEGGLALASQGLFRDPEPDMHAASIYQFSFAPWHLPEYLWPNFSGNYFPQYRRWLMAWPGEPRMWNQSVYLGLLPLLLAIGMLRLRRGSVREQWLSWCVVIAVLASFGAYGVCWLLRMPLLMAGLHKLALSLPGDQVGGLYWFFVTFLPSYAYFRFPAKLLTFAACPLCLLAAQGLDRLHETPRPRLQWAVLAIAAISGLGVLAVLSADEWFAGLARSIAPDSVYGPFDKEGARHDLMLSFLHTLAVAGVLYLLIKWRPWIAQQRISLSLVAITAAELVVANATMIGTAPSDVWRERPLLADLLERDRLQQEDETIRPSVRSPAAHDMLDPEGWAASSSPLRLEEWAAADRHLLQTNHSLAGPIDATDCLTSLRPAAYTYFYQRYHRNDESYWGNYWIMPQALPSIGVEGDANPWTPLPVPALAELTRCQVFRHEQPFPRAWIVHEVTALPELRSRDPYVLSLRGAEVIEKKVGDRVLRRDFRREAVVETDLQLPAMTSPQPGQPAESCRIVVSEPNRIVIEVDIRAPGLLVLGDTFDSNWTATSDSLGPLPIHRTNRMFRGVALPAGRDRVRFEYRPQALQLGAVISGLGWLAILVLLVFIRVRPTAARARLASIRGDASPRQR